jgi:hypothetical protein
MLFVVGMRNAERCSRNLARADQRQEFRYVGLAVGAEDQPDGLKGGS